MNNLRSIYDNSRLAKLIKRGILRIFPLPKVVIVIVIVIVSTMLISCATPKRIYGELGRTTQLVIDTRVDTLYLSNTQYDSIYIYKDRYQDRSKDTVYLKDVSIEYRYRMLRDTVRIIERDSIPYQVTITEVKEITRPLTWFDHLTRSVFWLVCGILFVKLVFNLKKAL